MGFARVRVQGLQRFSSHAGQHACVVSTRVRAQGLEPYLQQQSTIEDCVGMLDDLIGPAPQQLDPPPGKGKGADPIPPQMDIMDR